MRPILVMVVAVSCAFAQGDKSTKPAAKTVTVTGCIYAGVECLLLKNSKGKQDYSIAKTDKLQVGHSYRITGPVSDVGFCQEGKPILGPKKITELRLKCSVPAKPGEKNSSAQDWQKLPRQLRSSGTYNSGWLDLIAPTKFAKGEKLRISIGGTASKVVVRLLPVGAAADDQSGILGDYKVEKSGVFVITLGEDHEKIKQVSVHGGPNPWGVWDLGGGNGPATLKGVERSSP